MTCGMSTRPQEERKTQMGRPRTAGRYAKRSFRSFINCCGSSDDSEFWKDDSSRSSLRAKGLMVSDLTCPMVMHLTENDRG